MPSQPEATEEESAEVHHSPPSMMESDQAMLIRENQGALF